MDIRAKNRLTFLIYALLLGTFIGAATWLFLQAMEIGLTLIWEELPARVNCLYLPVVICTAGGILVGLCRKYFGNVPGVLSLELQQIKKTKRADYQNLPGTVISGLIPLIFGGSIGPEAALVSLLAGLSTWIADRIQSTAKNIKAYTEIGAAATLSALFGSPFFGFAETFESRKKSFFSGEDKIEQPLETPENNSESMKITADMQLPPYIKSFIYFAAALAAFGIFALLSHFFSGSGIYRYSFVPFGITEWLFLIPLAVVGSLAGYLYYAFGLLIRKGIRPIKEKKILTAALGGFFLGAIGVFLPYTLFSGEAQIAQIAAEWAALPAAVLLLTAILKIFLSRLCFLTGWRGGHIFPILFSGLVFGYAVASVIPVEPTFCALICSVALTGMVLRKPVATVLVYLILCPLEYLIPLSLAMGICCFMPFPQIFQRAEQEEREEELAETKRRTHKAERQDVEKIE